MTEVQRQKEKLPVAQDDTKDVERDPFLLSDIVQSSQYAIISEDLNGNITSWNNGAESIYGYSSEEVLGKSSSILVPAGRKEDVPAFIQKIANGESIEPFETVRVAKDGRRISVSLSISPIKNRTGKIIGASRIARDITAQRKVSDERLHLAAIVESSADAVLGLTFEGIVTNWNLGAEKMFGYSSKEIIGQSVRIISSEEHLRELLAMIEKVKLGQRIDNLETQRNRKDGTVVDVSLSISPIKDEVGEITGVSEILRDVTIQMQAARYTRSLIEASLDPLVTISPDGKITDVNEATVHATGVPHDKLIGTDFSGYFTDPESARAGYRKVLSEGKIVGHPLTLRQASGKTVEALYNASVYKDSKGAVLGVFASLHDITAQKQTSQYARSLIEASLDPLFTISPDGKITDVNEATVQVTGLQRDMLIGSDFISHFTDHEEARFAYEETFRKGSVRDYPLAIQNSSGIVTYVLYNATIYKDADGKALAIFAAARDITEQKRTEEDLRATSAYARSLIEASLDPLVTISADGKITDMNHATELITGVSREWLMGTDFSTYFTESGKAREGYRQTFKEGFVRDYPLSIRHASGRLTPVLYNATVYLDAAGKIRGVFASVHDVSETRQASQYARSLIEASLDPVVMISRDGKITDVNEAAVQVTGVQRDKLIGTDFSGYFTEPEIARAGYQRVFKEGFIKDYPLTLRSAGGDLTDLLYNVSVYKDSKGTVLGAFATARDVTAQKGASLQLEISNKELEAFSYSVSHDLRAPLRAIDSFSKILSDEYSERLDDEGKRVISVIRKSAKHMGLLIDDLLTLSRLGRSEVNKQDVDMKDMVTELFNELKPGPPAHEIKFTLNDIPNARVDPSLFRHVWTNLLSNAIKFTRDKDPPKIEVGSKVQDGYLVYYVRDNGAGFSMEYANKLFKVFTRLHSVQEFEGTGIGLAIVHQIVARHGGKVWADAKVGEGATFYVGLPLTGETS